MIKARKYFKKNYLRLETALLTTPWDFWPGHYLEVQIYRILLVDKVGKRTANRNEYLKSQLQNKVEEFLFNLYF